MTTQVTTTSGKAESVMRTACFVKGFKDKKAGKPIKYDAYLFRTNDAWNYERGRLFACIYDGPLKDGNRLTWQARQAFQAALRSNDIR